MEAIKAAHKEIILQVALESTRVGREATCTEAPLSEKAVQVSALLKNLGCQQQSATKLVEAYLGEPIVPARMAAPPRPLSVVCTNTTTYFATGIFDNDDDHIAVKVRGKKDPAIGYVGCAYRYATDEEVRTFIDQLFE